MTDCIFCESLLGYGTDIDTLACLSQLAEVWELFDKISDCEISELETLCAQVRGRLAFCMARLTEISDTLRLLRVYGWGHQVMQTFESLNKLRNAFGELEHAQTDADKVHKLGDIDDIFKQVSTSFRKCDQARKEGIKNVACDEHNGLLPSFSGTCARIFV